MPVLHVHPKVHYFSSLLYNYSLQYYTKWLVNVFHVKKGKHGSTMGFWNFYKGLYMEPTIALMMSSGIARVPFQKCNPIQKLYWYVIGNSSAATS